MTNGTTPAGGNGGDKESAPQRQIVLRQLYIKDMSFESPNSPAVFAEQYSPDVKLNLKSAHKSVGSDVYEVVLHLSAHATAKERSLFLVELEQAGVFQVAGYSAEETKRILGVQCLNTLFPYAREAIYSLVSKGGFPPLLLQHINFGELYAQSVRAQDLA
jgi:preprotein translocase subunit SecB